MKEYKNILTDVFEWDVINWSVAASFWEMRLRTPLARVRALELGARNGGLSLWLANKGAHVICSDIRDPNDTARCKHDLYGVACRVSYEKIDARYIPYENHFDIVAFKSLLGGVRANFGDDAHLQVIDAILRSLKPGGQLLFAENLEGSGLHRFFRDNFIKWGKTWKYLKFADIPPLFSGFSQLEFSSCGFAGAFGRSEWQRRFLGELDGGMFNKIVPKDWHYIAIGVATKAS